jgi:hypothetical protein
VDLHHAKTATIAAVLAFLLAGSFQAFGANRSGEGQVSLNKAHSQLEIAIRQAELSLGPHQPGSGWTRMHMQRVLNVVQGVGGPDFNKDVDNPGDGHGLVNYLKEARQALDSSSASPDTIEAIEHALAYIHETAEHARRSLKGTSVSEVHGHARLTAGMLMAARGSRNAQSPVTGALDYAMRAAESHSER